MVRVSGVIYKYPLELGVTLLDLPLGAEVLEVQVQDGMPVMWVLVPADIHAVETRLFRPYGTGQGVDSNPRKFIGTFQLGGFVGHLFEEF